MYERDLRSKRFQPLALGGNIRQGFATERSAKMAQKNQQQGLCGREFRQRCAGLSAYV
jgi:hypothetical protein